MELNNLKYNKGARKKRKRVGRGAASGYGKTAGRGENGQKSRSGYSKKIGFEGGQNPLYKRIPKRGFTPINRPKITILNLKDVDNYKVTEITPKVLIENKIIKKNYGILKIIGNQKLKNKIKKVEVHKITKGAQKSLEKVGAKIVLIK